MTKPEAIKKIFGNNKELSSIWEVVFDPRLNCIDPFSLTLMIEKYNSKYKGSLKNYIINNFGEEVFEALL